MSLVDWLKALTERQKGAGEERAPRKAHGPAASPRPPRKGGESYAKEWVKVLEDNLSGRDSYNTYTWELKPDATGSVPAPGARTEPAKPQAVEPFDTYTWELQESDSPDDPWGLKKDPPPQKPAQKDGVNPYDTGVFDASWTGQFDKR